MPNKDRKQKAKANLMKKAAAGCQSLTKGIHGWNIHLQLMQLFASSVVYTAIRQIKVMSMIFHLLVVVTRSGGRH